MKESTNSPNKWLKIVGFGIGGLIVLLLILMFIIPKIFADDIDKAIQNNLNSILTTEFTFSTTEVSFFKHFPVLTFSIYDIKIDASAPFEDEHLMKADELYCKVDIFNLIFSNDVKINAIVAENADVALKFGPLGKSNYDIYKTSNQSNAESETHQDFLLQIHKIELNDSDLYYDDQASKIKIELKAFNFSGDGSIFTSQADIYSVFYAKAFKMQYDDVIYFENKSIDAEIKSIINTDKLTFLFEKNKIKINELPFDFEGEFSLLKEGYFMDVVTNFDNVKLKNFITALPPKYNTWRETTNIKGVSSISVQLKGHYNAEQNIYPDLALDFTYNEGEIDCKVTTEKLQNINIDASVFIPQFNTDRADININNFRFDLSDENLVGYYKETYDEEGKYIDSKIESHITLHDLSNAIGVDGLEMAGDLSVYLETKGYQIPEQNKFPKSNGQFEIYNASIKTPFYPKPIDSLNANMVFKNPTGTYQDAVLQIKDLNFSFEGEPFTAQGSFENFEDLKYDITAQGQFNLNHFYELLGLDHIQLEGYIKANLNLKGQQSDIENANYDQVEHSGNMVFSNISFKSENYPKPILLKDGQLDFTNTKTSFKNFKVQYDSSDVSLDGDFKNLISYLVTSKKALKGDINLKSDFINLNAFIPSYASIEDDSEIIDTTDTDNYGVLRVPSRVNLNTKIEVEHILYDSINLYNSSAKLAIKDSTFVLESSNLNLIDAKAQMKGLYRAISPTEAQFQFNIKLQNFDIHRAYEELPLFRAMVEPAAYTEGIAGIEYQLKGILDAEMTPIYPSLEGRGVIRVKNGQIKGYKLLGKVSKSTDISAIEAPELNEVIIPTRIKDNIINIDEFKIKHRGFRLKTEGQSSFDGDLNLRMRLGLPPFGIIGIPLKVIGDSDDPKIKLGRRTKDLETLSYKQYLELQKDSLQQDLDSLEIKKLQVKFKDQIKADSLKQTQDQKNEQIKEG